MTQLTRRADAMVRRYEYDDGVTVVADLDVPDEAVTVDVVDGAAIVVVEDESEQYEVELPDGDAHTFMRNGVLTVEVRG